MTKALNFVSFVVIAVLAAGVFGALHDQLSYTVSPEYFTRFKFAQFDLLDRGLPERIRAAQVGFLASWWMGIPLGILTGAVAFIHRDAAAMSRSLLWSLVLIVAITSGAALTGLVYGFIQTRTIELSSYHGWYIPDGVEHLRRYLCAGYMHNAAYLGGAASVPCAWVFHVVRRLRSTPAA